MLKFQSFLSSSSGNATFITDDTVSLLVDCGANGKYITECMRRIGISPIKLSGILVTHEHRDHIAGIGVMSRKYNIPVYATEKTWNAIGDSIGPIRDENRKFVLPELNFGSLSVKSFKIPHDAADPVGYRFESDDQSFTIATDIGHITNELESALIGSDAVIIEANHDEDMLNSGPYPFYLKKRILSDKGHLSNKKCGDFCAKLAETGTSSIWLGHLSSENNTPELAYKTVKLALSEHTDTMLNVLPKYWIL